MWQKTCEAMCNRCAPWSLTALRVVVGLIFIYHGYPKLFGETEAMVAFFSSTPLPAPALMVTLAGIIEFFGGILLVAGLFTRYVATIAAVEFIIIILVVKLRMGWASMELDLLILAGLFVLACAGANWLSLDKTFGMAIGDKHRSKGGSGSEAIAGQ